MLTSVQFFVTSFLHTGVFCFWLLFYCSFFLLMALTFWFCFNLVSASGDCLSMWLKSLVYTSVTIFCFWLLILIFTCYNNVLIIPSLFMFLVYPSDLWSCFCIPLFQIALVQHMHSVADFHLQQLNFTFSGFCYCLSFFFYWILF